MPRIAVTGRYYRPLCRFSRACSSRCWLRRRSLDARAVASPRADPGETVSVLDLIGRDQPPPAPLGFSPPAIQRVASGLYWRTAVMTSPGTWTWDVPCPPAGASTSASSRSRARVPMATHHLSS